MDPSARRIAAASVVALCVGLAAVVVMQGFSADPAVKALETLAIVVLGVAVIFGGAMALGAQHDLLEVLLRRDRLPRPRPL